MIHFVVWGNFIPFGMKLGGPKRGRIQRLAQVDAATLLYIPPPSMVPVSFSNSITRGADWTFGLQMHGNGACSALVDVTDWIFSATLTTSAGAPLTTPAFALHTPECPVFSLTHTQTAALAKQTGAVLTIHATRPDGLELILGRGRVTIN
jgi:hypothetical protein